MEFHCCNIKERIPFVNEYGSVFFVQHQIADLAHRPLVGGNRQDLAKLIHYLHQKCERLPCQRFCTPDKEASPLRFRPPESVHVAYPEAG